VELIQELIATIKVW